MDACAKEMLFADWMIGVQSDDLNFYHFIGIRLDLWCKVTLIKRWARMFIKYSYYSHVE